MKKTKAIDPQRAANEIMEAFKKKRMSARAYWSFILTFGKCLEKSASTGADILSPHSVSERDGVKTPAVPTSKSRRADIMKVGAILQATAEAHGAFERLDIQEGGPRVDAAIDLVNSILHER
jgi:hypothetical protein